MVAVTRAAVRQNARALARLVDEAVERLPGEYLPAVYAILQGAHNTIAALQPSAALSESVTPAEVVADYFPVAAGSVQQVTPRALREAQARWDVAAERGEQGWIEAMGAIGPLLAPGEVAARLGVSTSTVNNWRNRSKLLALRFDDHQYEYPAFQFATSPAESDRGLVPHFAAILPLLADRSPWARAQFFITPSAALGDETPLAVLQRGEREGIERVRRLAQQAGELGG
jgi:hypothetical protein